MKYRHSSDPKNTETLLIKVELRIGNYRFYLDVTFFSAGPPLQPMGSSNNSVPAPGVQPAAAGFPAFGTATSQPAAAPVSGGDRYAALADVFSSSTSGGSPQTGGGVPGQGVDWSGNSTVSWGAPSASSGTVNWDNPGTTASSTSWGSSASQSATTTGGAFTNSSTTGKMDDIGGSLP